MHCIKHPFDGSLYYLMDDGRIRITDGDREGLFHLDGRWISGDIKQADPQLCVWIGNRPLPGGQQADWGLAPRKSG